MKTSKTMDAWAAGVIDGEGCITIKFRKKSKKEKCAAYFGLRVIVGQSGKKIPKMLKVLKANYGGTIGAPYTPSNEHRMQRWMWGVASLEAEKFLTRIKPYLIEKADEGAVALEYRAKAMGRGKWEIAKRYYIKLRRMKHYEKRSTFWLERTRLVSGG